MGFRCLLIILFICNISFSQEFKRNIKDNKINFKFIKKSKYEINDFIVYGDSIMFAVDFPHLKSIKNLDRRKSSNRDSYIYFDKFKKRDKDKLLNILYHINEQIDGEFNTKENRTTLIVTRNDDNLKGIFQIYFKTTYNKFQYKIIIDYNKKKIFYNYPNVSYTFNFSEKEFEVIYNVNYLEGHYKEQNNNIEERKIVYFDENLNPKISLDKIFLNQKYGLKRIESVFETIVLLE